jgi:hypothetical protein
MTPDASGEKVVFGGLLTGVRRILTKTKSQMAVLTLEDLHGTIEAVVFPRIYEKSADALREDVILVIEGKLDTRSDRPQVVVDRAEEWTAPPKGTPLPEPVVRAASGSRAGGSRSDGHSANGNRDGAAGANGNGAYGARGANASAAGGQRSEGSMSREKSDVSLAGDTANGHGPNGNGNGAANGNGHAAGPHKRVLRVVVPRGDDDNACVRLLEQLHVLVERYAGDGDELQLVLHDRTGGQIALANTDINVRHTPELESQVKTLLGADNLQVVG